MEFIFNVAVPMLTTEQVYALMRGDVEGAQEHARTGRFETTTAEDLVEEAASAAAIASWDEGVPLADSPVPRTTPTKTPQRSSPPTASEKPSNAWKDWDEQ